MIKVNNLSFARGNTLIYKGINFKILPGELLLIKGANGVGKTTLLSNIVNFTDPLEGSITYNGTEIDNLTASQFFLYIGETNFAYDALSLNQNIEYWLSIHNVKFDKSIKNKSVKFFFQELNLDKKFYQLSFGQKKKLQLLLLMLVNKPVWILDDPFSGLDSKSIQNVNTLFEKKLENKGIIILTSHQGVSLNDYKTLNLV
tara:strand:- start:443 stop:1045 length:603 start_codon:yes stop_codon:yes gene_type:complete